MLDDLRRDLETLLLDGPVCVVFKRPELREDARNVFAYKLGTVAAVLERVQMVEGRAANVYVVRNPSGLELMVGRGETRHAAGPGEVGNPPLDGEVSALRWLPIDIDPVYPEGPHDPRTVEAAARASALGALAALELGDGLALWGVMNSGRGTQAQIRFAQAAAPTPENVTLYRACARALYARLGAAVDATVAKVDGSVLNPARQTRLVGTVNPRTGLRAAMLQEGRQEVASLPALAALLGVDPLAPAERPEAAAGSEGDLSPELLEEILRALDVLEYADRETYLRIAFAVATATDKSEDAWDLFDEWSAGDEEKYNAAGNRAIWDSCRVEGGGVGVGTLIHELAEAGADRALIARVAARGQTGPQFPDDIPPAPVAAPAPTELAADPLFGGSLEAGPVDESPILSPAQPLPSAELYLTHRPHLKLYRDEWLEYERGAYIGVEPGALKADVIAFLKRARCRKITPTAQGPRIDVVQFPVTPRAVSDVLDMLTGPGLLHDIEIGGVKREAPFWITGEGPEARGLIACRNGLLEVASSVVLPHTPRYFTRIALPYAHDAAAAAPRWTRFLDDIFPGDPESRALMQEVFGYLVSTETKHQALFLMHGKSGSGKSTSTRVLRALIGTTNCTSPKISSLTKEFGLMPLIGKSLAIIEDARIGPRTDAAALLENLLSISGENEQSINRKNRPFWEGKLFTRILVVTNRFPHLPDEAGALARRLIPLRFRQSFAGRADLDLTERLLTELPGILNWALDGLRRLRERGHFELPEESRVDLAEMARESSPIRRFVEDHLELAPHAVSRKDEVYRQYQVWCQEQNEKPIAYNAFGRELLELHGEQIKSGRGPRDSRGRQPGIYVGARIVEGEGSTASEAGDPLDFPPIH